MSNAHTNIIINGIHEFTMKKHELNTLISAILAGAIVGIGGTVYLSVENKVIGAVLFTIGLFCICTKGLHLFTGKVCYVFDNDRQYAVDLIYIWLGNLIGSLIVGGIERFTRIGDAISEKAAAICAVKLGDDLLSIFILAIFCDVLIYIGVDGYKNNTHEIGKYLALFFGVVVFILCGFEHCVANMYYFTIAGAWSGKTILYLLVMTLGNAVGGVIVPLVRKGIKA